MDEINIIRCPSCGGLHLKGVYDASESGRLARKALFWGLWGTISALRKAKASSGAYWQCEDCGCTFPMELGEASK